MSMKRLLRAIVIILMAVLITGCGQNAGSDSGGATGSDPGNATASGTEDSAPKDIVILFTSDMHCGVDQGWTLAGIQQIRDTLQKDGTPVLLVDNGDAIQGAPIGMLSNGKAVADLMNEMGYDAVIPGNHEFDYGMDDFLSIAENAKCPYISCNFNKEGELVFDPYVIKEAGDKKVAFVGVTTPTTITSSTPLYFQDESGEFIYDFMQKDRTGQEVYDAIQKSVDAARAEGADYVILLGHLGMYSYTAPWDYASVVANTSGIDAVLDGHSHDVEQAAVKNKDGVSVPRGACGTKLENIGWCRISGTDDSISIGLYRWENDVSAMKLLGLDNDMSHAVSDAMADIDEKVSEVVGKTPFELTIYDPEQTNENGDPIRIVRVAETNMGDLITDAFRDQTGADIAIIGGGAVRAAIQPGEFTIGDILNVMPFSEDLCVAEVTGQQILDALEFGSHRLPNEFGSFLQVSGLTYEIDMSVPSSCTTDDDGLFSGVAGERRVRNVLVGGEPIDPDKKYTVVSIAYTMKEQGNGMSMFHEEDVVSSVMIDNEAVMNYIEGTLGGVVGEEYSDPYGQGRIVAVE